MTQTNEIPPPCQDEIFKKGACIFMTDSIPAAKIEAWVKKIAEESGQPVDWHYAGGRVIVLALGDLSKVMLALDALMPEHNRMKQEVHDELNKRFGPPKMISLRR